MRSFWRAGLVAVVALLWINATALGQVNGDATISAPDGFGKSLTVSTSTQFAGAVSSIKWNGKEFINNWDHGRQLSPNYQFFNRFICYNPYETGSLEDGKSSTSTSRVLSLSAV